MWIRKGFVLILSDAHFYVTMATVDIETAISGFKPPCNDFRATFVLLFISMTYENQQFKSMIH